MEPRDKTLLEWDLELIRDALEDISAYRFSEDLKEQMRRRKLSSLALSRRCGTSHTTVDKWCSGASKPNSKERMKALGMALEQNEEELNNFLFRNNYPRLYIKNPLDCAAKMLLFQRGGQPDNLLLYEEILSRLRLSRFVTSSVDAKGNSGSMSVEFRQAVEKTDVSEWFEAHSQDFRGDDSTLRMDSEMKEYVRLYLGDGTVRELVQTGQLPAPLKNTLYALLSGKAVKIRGLRRKLIALGTRVNMTDEELDLLLSFARLRPVTQPETRAEFAHLMALRLAHERYPGYELVNLEQISRRLPELKSEALKTVQTDHCVTRLPEVQALMDYYERHASPEDRRFEERYTAYNDRCLSDYLSDILGALVEEGLLEADETAALLQG